MKDKKILNNDEIDWYGEGITRLNYQMIFQEEVEDDLLEDSAEDEIDLAKLLKERDKKWQEKLEYTREKAEQEAYRKGLEEGRRQAEEQIDNKLNVIRTALEHAGEEWKNMQELLRPGMIDLGFEVAESILKIPVENPAIRSEMDATLIPLLRKTEIHTKPHLKVNAGDFERVKELYNEYAPELPLVITEDESCLPGEFLLETNEESLVHTFKEMLNDFRSSLSLPSWK